jgi:hypothetical protein
MTVKASSAALLALLLMSAGATADPSPAQQFSADIVSRDATGQGVGEAAKLYVSNGKVRIETPDAPAGYFLIDATAATAFFVSPARRVYMDARQSTRLTRIFLPVDPENPCPKWQAAAKNAGMPNADDDWRCEQAKHSGSELLDGRRTIRYALVSPDRESSQRWIDPNLAFPVKLRAPDGTTIALEHIRIEPQPPTLFTLPPGYRKSSPQSLIDRIKHSDVWVNPPQ